MVNPLGFNAFDFLGVEVVLVTQVYKRFQRFLLDLHRPFKSLELNHLVVLRVLNFYHVFRFSQRGLLL